MIRINLYDYRRVLREIEIQKGFLAAFWLLVLGFSLAGAAFLSDQMRVTQITEEADALQGQVNGKKGEYDAVQALKETKSKLSSMVVSLSGLRTGKIHFTRLLADVGDSLPPGLWLDKIKQAQESDLKNLKVPILFLTEPDEKSKKKKGNAEEGSKHLFIEFRGNAVTDRDVARFMERIEALAYLDHVILSKSEERWLGTVPIRKFIVFAHVAGSGT